MKKAGAFLKWLFDHPAWLVAIGCAFWGLLQLHEARHWRKIAAADQTQITQLSSALKTQNDAVAALKAAGDRQQKLAEAAIAQAKKKGDSARRQADVIENTPPPKTVAPCPTPDVVKGVEL